MVGKRRSTRLKKYDYALAGAYFVTICSRKRECIFGDIKDNQMILNNIGEIIASEWLRTFEMRPYIELDEFIIMPNHMHGIIVYDDHIRARPASPLQRQPIGIIIGAFKSAVTKQVNNRLQNQDRSIWQRNYYDHIVRNEKELNEVRQYISDNPACWDDDRNNPNNV